MHRPRRILAAILCLALTLSFLPGTSWAATAQDQETTTESSVEPALETSQDSGFESHPEKVRPTDVTAEWSSYRGTDGTNTTTADVPTEKTGLSWVRKLYKRQGWTDMNGISEPILVDGRVFVAVSSQLLMLDPSSGTTLGTAELAAPIDSTCRMTYADGVIVVPLDGGSLQAVTPDDLTTVWVTPEVDQTGSQQSLSTLTVADGYVFAGTSDANRTEGYLRCVSLSDGTVLWTHQAEGSAYYWAGGAMTPHGLLIAQNSGKLDLMDPQDGSVRTSLPLPSEVRSTIVTSPDGNTAYAMGYDGTLYKVDVSASALSVERSQELCRYSISTPTIADGRLYVGGSAPDDIHKGALYVLDADTLKVEDTVTGFDDGTELEGPVASSPLVAVRGDGTYVYFTANDAIGGAYLYRVGDDTARYLYVPSEDQLQYTLSSVAADSAGALYYINDSGNLFKVGGDLGADNKLPSEDGQPADEGSSDDSGKKATSDSSSSRSGSGGSASGGGTRATGSGGSSSSGGQATGTTTGTAKGSSAATSASSLEPTTTSPEDESGSPLGILDEDSSDELGTTGREDAAPASEEGANAGDQSPEQGRQVPVWPVIGIVAGLAVLVAVMVRSRQRKGAHGKERS